MLKLGTAGMTWQGSFLCDSASLPLSAARGVVNLFFGRMCKACLAPTKERLCGSAPLRQIFLIARSEIARYRRNKTKNCFFLAVLAVKKTKPRFPPEFTSCRDTGRE